MRAYLLLMDDHLLAENLAELLRLKGEHAEIAASGDEAIERAGGRRFDALLADLHLPLPEVADKVRSVHEVDAQLPALLLTTYSGDERYRVARCEGILAILRKPVEVPRMLELLARARRGGLVALLEEDPALSDELCKLLCAQGFSTVSASSLLETDRAAGLRPFAGVADVRGGSKHSLELVSQLDERFPGVPLLVYSPSPPPSLPERVLIEEQLEMPALLGRLEEFYRAAAPV